MKRKSIFDNRSADNNSDKRLRTEVQFKQHRLMG